MSTRTLVESVEARDKSSYGRYYGFEIFDVDGSFRLVVHTSTYEGIRRVSHWASPEVAMQSLTREAALQEAARTTTAYARTFNPTLDLEIP